MLVEPVTTWLLVRISPVELMIIPVPAALLDPMTVLMSTMAGSTFAAIASAVVPPDDGLVLGVAGVIGDSAGGVVAEATGRLLTTRARLQPMPAPATAATTAISTTKAAMRCQTEVGGGGGAGAHAGGGSSVWPGGSGRVPPLSCGFSTDIRLYLRNLPLTDLVPSKVTPAAGRGLYGCLVFPGNPASVLGRWRGRRRRGRRRARGRARRG